MTTQQPSADSQGPAVAPKPPPAGNDIGDYAQLFGAVLAGVVLVASAVSAPELFRNIVLILITLTVCNLAILLYRHRGRLADRKIKTQAAVNILVLVAVLGVITLLLPKTGVNSPSGGDVTQQPSHDVSRQSDPSSRTGQPEADIRNEAQALITGPHGCLPNDNRASNSVEQLKIEEPGHGDRIADSLTISLLTRLTAGQHLYFFLYRIDMCTYNFLPHKQVTEEINPDGRWPYLYVPGPERGKSYKAVAAVVDEHGHLLLQAVLALMKGQTPWVRNLPSATRVAHVDISFVSSQ